MKKLVIAAVILFCGLTSLSAQPRSIGGSIGTAITAIYQHSLHNGNFIETNLGYYFGTGPVYSYDPISGYNRTGKDAVRLSATYNIIILSPKWTSKGDWNFYAGPGLSLGSGFNPYRAFTVGIAGQAGLEYNFWFPLTLSADLRPTFGIMVSDGRVKYDVDGLLGLCPSVSAKFRF